LKSFFPGFSFLVFNIGTFLLIPIFDLFILYIFNNYFIRVTKFIKQRKNIILVFIIFIGFFILNKYIYHSLENYIEFTQLFLREIQSYSTNLLSNVKNILPFIINLFDHLSIIFHLLFMLINIYNGLFEIASVRINEDTESIDNKKEFLFLEEGIVSKIIILKNAIVIRGPNSL
jgi:hypothetical protein